jgi:hypothetical protein
MEYSYIDYYKLLVKYISYVKGAEGIDFIEDGKDLFSDVNFTKEEWDALDAISNMLSEGKK